MANVGLRIRRYPALPRELTAHWREASAAAIAIFSLLSGYNLTSWWFVPLVVVMLAGIIIDSRNDYVDKWGVGLAFVVVLSGLWAVFVQRTDGQAWEKTAVLLAYPAIYMGLMFIRPSARFLYMLIPVGVFHAGLIFVQTMQGTFRPTGITDSANPAGGFLAIISLALLQTRWWPLAPLTIFAMTLTGSRLAVLAFLAGFVIVVLTRHVKNWPAAISAICIASALVWFGWDTVGAHLFHSGETPLQAELMGRTREIQAPSIFPSGYDADLPPIHSLYLIIFVEYGLTAGLAIAILVGLGLKRVWRRPQLSIALSILVLASLDLYLWIGPMAWLWWWFLSQHGTRTRLPN